MSSPTNAELRPWLHDERDRCDLKHYTPDAEPVDSMPGSTLAARLRVVEQRISEEENSRKLDELLALRSRLLMDIYPGIGAVVDDLKSRIERLEKQLAAKKRRSSLKSA